VDAEEFDAIFRAARSRHAATEALPEIKIFDFWRTTEQDLASVEAILEARLPRDYREFMLRYGGGQFLFLDIYPVISPSPGRDGLVEANRHSWSDPTFVAVAPVGSGDQWGFSLIHGVCQDQVSFLDHEDGQRSEEASDFFEFVARRGLLVDQ
jgi:SMI1-KNR4 cell-wall